MFYELILFFLLTHFFFIWRGGVGNYQMYAELQVLSPLVPTRESHFLRYCQQNVEEGSWTIVDFPLDDNFHQYNNIINNFQTSFPTYKRRPSGCVIQDMPNGYSRVRSLFRIFSST